MRVLSKVQCDMSVVGRYTHAVVCRLADSVTGCDDVQLARKQHEQYVRTLRELQLDVIELPADQAHPHCVMIQDCAVVCNGIALLCRPGLPSRRAEVNAVRAVIKKELELPIVEMPDKSATLDGGDVLFTGREFFVGVSSRSNEAGAAAVAAAFPEYACTPVRIPVSSGHLKSLITLAGPDILCVSETQDAQLVLKRIEREATFRYRTLTVREAGASNCLFVNGALLHRGPYECPAACKVFESRLNVALKPLSFSELCKAGAGLSCCSLLIRKSKRVEL